MQIVILAGGLATKLGILTKEVPKSMLRIEGKPFLEYQIEIIKNQGFKDIILCVGHLAHKIVGYFGKGNHFGVNLTYSFEKVPLGTGGALKNAEELIDKEFFLLYGDSYLSINYNEVYRYHKKSSTIGTMVIYKNYNKYDKSNVILNKSKVKIYDKSIEASEKIYIDAGLSVYKKDFLRSIPKDTFVQLDAFIQKLTKEEQLSAFITDQRFYEIGSFSGLNDFRKYLKVMKIK